MAPELNGKATHADFVTPFNSFEQVARQSHEVAETEPLSVHSGLQAAEYQHQEFPKAVSHVDVKGEPVTLEEIAASPETHFEPVIEEE